MSEDVPAALKEPGAGLIELERELTRLLIEYDELDTAWPKGRHVLVRAKIGRQATDTLLRIADLQHAIATTPARTVTSTTLIASRPGSPVPTATAASPRF